MTIYIMISTIAILVLIVLFGAVTFFIYAKFVIWRKKKEAAKAWAALPLVQKLAYSKFLEGTVLYDRKTAAIIRMDKDAELCRLVATTKDRFRKAAPAEIVFLGTGDIARGIVAPDYVGYGYFAPDLEAIKLLENEQKA